ncbi:MAG: hypothetical protein V4596_03755 [Bdellovibrionota bacterium]
MKKVLRIFITIALTLSSLSLKAQEQISSTLKEYYLSMPASVLRGEIEKLEAESDILLEREKLLNDFLRGKYQIFPRYNNKMIVGGIIIIAGSVIILPNLPHFTKKGEGLKGIILGMYGAAAGAIITFAGGLSKLLYETDTSEFLAEIDASNKEQRLALRSYILEEKSNNYAKRLLIQEIINSKLK